MSECLESDVASLLPTTAREQTDWGLAAAPPALQLSVSHQQSATTHRHGGD